MLINKVHPLYQNRNNLAHWYSDHDVADYVCAQHSYSVNAACSSLFNGQTGLAFNGQQISNFRGMDLYGFEPLIPNYDLLTHLSDLRNKTGDATPRGITIPTIVGKNHFSVLHVRQDQRNPDRADIVYVNPFGSNSGYRTGDDRVIDQARSSYAAQDTRVIVSNERLQTDSYSCGPLAVAISQVLETSAMPESLINSGRLPNQSQATKLRLEQGEYMRGRKPKLFADLAEQYNLMLDAGGTIQFQPIQSPAKRVTNMIPHFIKNGLAILGIRIP